ncbi:hypothetical protein E4U03_12420 [Rothia nasimurium]|uniref:Uncharacterized protein n=1 Tax=Rothia nasimurium TaxID=85336 RepID=A0A4Y9F001_9MICC|nr:hypothetical protein [Rothia nasimurium]MBF0809401.1 hypothetical protein [Rothia nasimurium]TFU19441.1 hypothetical protein E4U03_12420 [Rothia nasimurium]
MTPIEIIQLILALLTLAAISAMFLTLVAASRRLRRGLSQYREKLTRNLQEAESQAWEEGFTQGAAYYYEGNSKPTDFTETAHTLNPHKETN